MKLRIGKIQIELEENVNILIRQIEELNKLREYLDKTPEKKVLAGKTQMIGKEGQETPKSTRSRKEHSDLEGVEFIASQIIKGIYQQALKERLNRLEKSNKENKDKIREQILKLYKVNLEKELLVLQVICEIHDFGHTPNGHTGERTINRFIKSQQIPSKDIQIIMETRRKIFGDEYEEMQGHPVGYNKSLSFEHNEQSARLLYNYATEIGTDQKLVDLPRLIKGVLAHSTSRVPEEYIEDDITLQAVRYADTIENVISDLEEIKTCINLDKFPKNIKSFVDKSKKEKQKEVINRIIKEAVPKGNINDELSAIALIKEIEKIYRPIVSILGKDGKSGLVVDENEERITSILEKILQYYMQNTDKTQETKIRIVHPINEDKSKEKGKIEINGLKIDKTNIEKVITYLCQMDDNQVKQTYKRLVRERIVKGAGNGIEPITKEEIEQKKKQQIAHMTNKVFRQDNGRHTIDECEEIAWIINENYIQNMLTQKAKNKMKTTRQKHNKENEIDEMLIQMMKNADSLRDEQGELSIKEKKEFEEKIKNCKENIEERS